MRDASASQMEEVEEAVAAPAEGGGGGEGGGEGGVMGRATVEKHATAVRAIAVHVQILEEVVVEAEVSKASVAMAKRMDLRNVKKIFFQDAEEEIPVSTVSAEEVFAAMELLAPLNSARKIWTVAQTLEKCATTIVSVLRQEVAEVEPVQSASHASPPSTSSLKTRRSP